MCDLKVRRLGNVQRYTVQCVLPINLFNEKMYLFLWFWIVFVATMSCLSLLTWSVRLVSFSDRRNYLKKHIAMMQDEGDKGTTHIGDDHGKHFRTFVEDYLRQDRVSSAITSTPSPSRSSCGNSGGTTATVSTFADQQCNEAPNCPGETVTVMLLPLSLCLCLSVSLSPCLSVAISLCGSQYVRACVCACVRASTRQERAETARGIPRKTPDIPVT